jgi:8-amino-7-oxononanoate synthase
MSPPQAPRSTAAHPGLLLGSAGARITLNGREYINFAGSTYLALGNQQELRSAARKALKAGAAFSCQLPSVYGVADPFIGELEKTAASYCGTEAAVYIASGYLIGAAALMSLDSQPSMLFIDEDAHFSLFDAARLTAFPLVRFNHCDPEALEKAIRKNLPPGERPVALTDGLFGTTGRIAPLAEYAAILNNWDGRLVVDEAHSFGVLGAHGRGAVEHHGAERISALAATLSKAFCAQGAIVGCTQEAAERLRRLPPLRGANAGSPISAAVASASLCYMQAHPERRERLRQLTAYLRKRLRNIGIETGDSPAPIFAFHRGARQAMLTLQQQLFERGIYVLMSSYIGAGQDGVIRCAVFADHSEADLDTLAGELESLPASLAT